MQYFMTEERILSKQTFKNNGIQITKVALNTNVTIFYAHLGLFIHTAVLKVEP